MEPLEATSCRIVYQQDQGLGPRLVPKLTTMILFHLRKKIRIRFSLFLNSSPSALQCFFRAYGTRARSGCGSQNCAILSILCSFTGNGAFLCVKDVVVDLPCRTGRHQSLLFNTNKYIIITVLTSSYTLFENTCVRLTTS